MKYLAVFGNTPELSALELSKFTPIKWQAGTVAAYQQPVEIDKLGGCIKLAEIIKTIPRSLEGIEIIFDELKQIANQTDKIRFGFSVYLGDDKISEKMNKHYAKKIQPLGLTWKKELRSLGKSVRLVTSKEPALSSVIVKKEHLLDHQTDFILVIYKKTITVAKTIAVQDFKAYSKRDYGRPQRDHKSGMLPPKVARMMINIAKPEPDDIILDPFCGSGTVLQEALVLGYKKVIGSDISEKCITDCEDNLAWLKLPKIALYQCDVKKISTCIKPKSVNCVVAEGFLGPTRPKKTDKVYRQMTKLYKNAFTELTKILEKNSRIVLAIPAWKRFDTIQTIKLNNTLNNLGYQEFHAPVFYGREHAKVLRQILFLEYK